MSKQIGNFKYKNPKKNQRVIKAWAYVSHELLDGNFNNFIPFTVSPKREKSSKNSCYSWVMVEIKILKKK